MPTGNEYKVIFVGDAAVGKSSLIRKICKGTFNNQRVSTTGKLNFHQLSTSTQSNFILFCLLL